MASRQAARRLLQSRAGELLIGGSRQLHGGVPRPMAGSRAEAIQGVSMLRKGYAYTSVSKLHGGRGFLGHMWHEHWDAFRNVAIDYGFLKMEPVYNVFRALFIISLARLCLDNAL